MLYLCFAAFNEQENLPTLFGRIDRLAATHSYHYHMLAYEDGSTDDTLHILQEAERTKPLTLLHEPVNHGLGYGIGKMIEHACRVSKDDSDIVIFFDADDTHDPEAIPAMLEKIAQGNDLVIASRFCKGGRMQGFPLYRMVLSYAASYYFRLLLPVPNVRDYTSGYRAWRITALKKGVAQYGDQLITETGFSCQVELLFKLSPYVRCDEVPIDYQYGRKKGASKMKLMRTIRRTIMVGWRILKMRSLNKAG